MKLLNDQARFELFSYKLTDLLNKYEEILELREETQALLFDVLEEIDKNDLSSIHVDYEKLGMNRQVELNNISEEVNIVEEYKTGFDVALDMIYSGVAEDLLINEALSNLLWVVVLGCDFFVQDIAFVPSYCHVSWVIFYSFFCSESSFVFLGECYFKKSFE